MKLCQILWKIIQYSSFNAPLSCMIDDFQQKFNLWNTLFGENEGELLILMGNYCVLPEYHKYILPSLTWIMGSTN